MRSKNNLGQPGLRTSLLAGVASIGEHYLFGNAPGPNAIAISTASALAFVGMLGFFGMLSHLKVTRHYALWPNMLAFWVGLIGFLPLTYGLVWIPLEWVQNNAVCLRLLTLLLLGLLVAYEFRELSKGRYRVPKEKIRRSKR